MIELDLQFFGGRGGSSGGGGGGGAGGTGTGTGSGHGHSKSRGSAGGMTNGGYHAPPSSKETNTTEKKEETRTPKLKTLTPNDISSKETYTLIRVYDDGSTKEYGDRTGEQLREHLAYEKLKYNSKEKQYTSAQKKKYIIVKKK